MSVRRVIFYIRSVVALGIALYLLSATIGVYADSLPNPTKIGLPFESSNVASSIGKIIRQGIMFAGVFAVMALTYGGILMMLSYGDENKAKSAKSVITYALVGVVLSGAAYAIIEAINALKLG